MVEPEKSASRNSGSAYSNTAARTTIESKNGGVLLMGDQGAALRGVRSMPRKKNITVNGASVNLIAVDKDGRKGTFTPRAGTINTPGQFNGNYCSQASDQPNNPAGSSYRQAAARRRCTVRR